MLEASFQPPSHTEAIEFQQQHFSPRRRHLLSKALLPFLYLFFIDAMLRLVHAAEAGGMPPRASRQHLRDASSRQVIFIRCLWPLAHKIEALMISLLLLAREFHLAACFMRFLSMIFRYIDFLLFRALSQQAYYASKHTASRPS